MRRMNAVDFADKFVESDNFEHCIMGSYSDFDPDLALTYMLDYAEESGITLVNIDLFEHEQYFWDAHDVIMEERA